jgi:GNAT superfamily N-acetyltransferase
MITYNVEADWPAFRRDIEPLIELHWREIALDHNSIKLNPDWDEYDRMDKAGMLHLVSVRNDGAMVGYFIGIVRPHLHYKDSLTSFCDVVFIKPEYRQGMVGVKLFKEVTKSLKERGIQKVYLNTKAHHDFGVVLERLDYRKTETIYTKVVN